MQRRNKPKRVYYFSDKLKKQLDQIPNYPLTVVEAPSGFGKNYRRQGVFKNKSAAWLPVNTGTTCLGEPASTVWRNICGLIANRES